MKSAPPIVLTLKAWTARRDAKAITADRAVIEPTIRMAHTATLSAQPPTGPGPR